MNIRDLFTDEIDLYFKEFLGEETVEKRQTAQPKRNVDFSFQFYGGPDKPQVSVAISREVDADTLMSYFLSGDDFGKQLVKSELTQEEKRAFAWVFKGIAARLGK
jgi:hypothetical protein